MCKRLYSVGDGLLVFVVRRGGGRRVGGLCRCCHAIPWQLGISLTVMHYFVGLVACVGERQYGEGVCR